MPPPFESNSMVSSGLRSNGTPRFKAGDKVWTNYTGKITEHTIHKSTTERISQSGVMYKVTPQLDSDWASWYDQGWFHPIESYAPSTINNS